LTTAAFIDPTNGLASLLDEAGVGVMQAGLEEDQEQTEDALSGEASARLDVLVVVDVKVAQIVGDLALRQLVLAAQGPPLVVKWSRP
jgi:hypothetical protein